MRKKADYNHLRFSLRCTHNRITPTSLQISSSAKSLRATKMPQKAQHQLLNEWVRQTNFTTNVLKSKWKRTQHRLIMDLVENTEKAHLAQHETSKTRQQRKLDLLVVHQKPQKNTESVLSGQERERCHIEDVNKWVKNLSETHPKTSLQTD